MKHQEKHLRSSEFITDVVIGLSVGFFKSKISGQPLFRGALKVTFIGLVAAASAFFIAKIISK